MEERTYSSYAEWYREGPFASYVRATGMAGDVISVIEATQPDGDLSDPPTNDLVLIRMLSSYVPCAIDLGAGKFSVSQRHGDFILVSPNTESDIQMYAPHSVEIFSLPAWSCLDLIGQERSRGLDFGRLHEGLFRSDLLNAICQRLVEAARVPEKSSRLFVDSASMALLGELSHLAGPDRMQRNRSDVRDWRIRSTLEQIEAQLADNISLATLAATVGLSPSRYISLFRAATGLSPHAWIVRRKIERACELLSDPKTSVTDVANKLGFCSSQHFANAFRANKGLSPTAWRRGWL